MFPTTTMCFPHRRLHKVTHQKNMYKFSLGMHMVWPSEHDCQYCPAVSSDSDVLITGVRIQSWVLSFLSALPEGSTGNCNIDLHWDEMTRILQKLMVRGWDQMLRDSCMDGKILAVFPQENSCMTFIVHLHQQKWNAPATSFKSSRYLWHNCSALLSYPNEQFVSSCWMMFVVFYWYELYFINRKIFAC